MEEKKEIKPEVLVQLVQGKPAEEKKEVSAETKAATPLLTKEALKMVHSILGRGFIREHPEEWAILKNRLKDEMRPVPAENEKLRSAIDHFEAVKKSRREAYEALPKCAECGSPRGRLMYFVSPDGVIKTYHPGQCAGERLLTFRYEAARAIAEKMKKRMEEDKNYSASILVNTLGGMLAASQVENRKRAEDRKDAQKIAAKNAVLKLAGALIANSMSSKNSNQTLIGKAMASAVIAKEKTKK